MEELVIEIINNFGYIGIFLLMALENLFPPIPSEIILTLGGFMTTQTTMNIWGVALAATAGSVLGAIILYSVGRLLSVERLERLCSGRLGRMLRFEVEDIRKAEVWFAKRGVIAVFFCRFIPIVRSLISIPAGSAKMKLYIFLPLTIAGSLIWNFVLVSLGRAAGHAWESVAHYFDIYSTVVLVLFVLAAILLGGAFIKKRFFSNK